MELNAAIKKLRKLDKAIKECSSNFYHSTVLVKYRVGETEINFDLRDMLLMCAISGNNLMLTGKTGGGKTMISRMVMAALFGDYGFLPVDITLDMNKLRDFFFGAIKEGKKLSDAVKTIKPIDAPGVIIDEYNRAPHEITNILQGYMQNSCLMFEGGKEVFPGVEIGGERYQWKIATLNVGEKYYGTRKVDKASRNRFGVEINLDLFEPTEEDKRKLIKYGLAKKFPQPKRSYLDDVLEIYKFVQKIKMGSRVEDFMLYFMRMNQCPKSPEGTKLSVNFNKEEYCAGCHCRLFDEEICCDVFAPPERTIGNWSSLAQAFALYRVTKYGGSPEIMMEDAIASAPFALYSKLDIDPGRIVKRASGSRWRAINDVVKLCYGRLRRFVIENAEVMRKIANGKKLSEEELNKLGSYVIEKDPWADDIRKFLNLKKARGD
jgi:hypothetical protein